MTLGIAGYILWQSFSEIGPVIRLLMLGSPPAANTDAIIADMRAVDGVADVHHVHLWMIDEHRSAVNAHIVVDLGAWGRADAIKSVVRQSLTVHGIAHTTLEIECSRHACQGAGLIGDAPAMVHGPWSMITTTRMGPRSPFFWLKISWGFGGQSPQWIGSA